MSANDEKRPPVSTFCRISGFLLLFSVLLLFSACYAWTPSRQSSNRSATPSHIILPTSLIATPRSITNDYTHPERTRQIFSWGRYGGEWRVLPADQTNSYAGFTLKKSQDISQYKQNRYLSFRMKPCVRDQLLSIALVSVNSKGTEIFSSIPIRNYRIREWGGWGLFAIPIEHFPNRGWVINTPNNTPTKAEIDWKNIHGLRLIANPFKDWAEPILIRDLQFGPARPNIL